MNLMTAVEPLPVAPLETLRKRRSQKWRTYPDDVVPLAVAEMDFDLAPPIAAALREAIDQSDTGYPAAIPSLGLALARFAGERWGWDIDPVAVTAAADVEVGVIELLRILIRPGDSIVVCPPVYPPFFDWVPEAGARLDQVPLVDGRLDLAGLGRAFALRPAAFLLCNPHNPVGRVHTREELTEVLRLARRYGVTVVSDEIHAPLVLPGATFTPILTIPGAAEVAVSVVSASKAWNLAGLKCASVVTASRRMATIVDQMPARIASGPGHLGVLASVAAYAEGGHWLDRLLATLDDRRTLVGRLLAERLPTVSWRPPEATYLAWLDCAAIGPSDVPWRHFLEVARVATVPGPSFGLFGSGHVRLNFATSPEILDAATARMADSLTSAA
jgi:cysteine-S-conjugate beta-lyase